MPLVADLMDNSKNQLSNLNGFPKEIPEKAPYSAPKILSREVLEAVAAACPSGGGGKAQGQAGCIIPSS